MDGTYEYKYSLRKYTAILLFLVVFTVLPTWLKWTDDGKRGPNISSNTERKEWLTFQSAEAMD